MYNKNIIWVDNVRVYAILAIVILHVSSGVVKGIPIDHINEWLVGNIFNSLTRWSVPVFVMISGFLLLSPRVDESNYTFYKKRLSKILIPLAFWSVFYLVYDGLMSSLSLYDMAKRLLFGIPYYHMWFIYMIIGLYIVTPFLRKILNILDFQEVKNLIIILFILVILNNIFNYFFWKNMGLFFNLFIEYIPYFLLGGMMKKFNYSWDFNISIIIFIFSTLLTSLGCYVLAKQVNLYDGLYFYNYLSLTVVPMSISMIMILQKSTKTIYKEEVMKKIAFLSFGIYLIHPLIINGLAYFNIVAKGYNPLVSVPLISITVFFISLVITYIIHIIPGIKRII